MNKIKVIDTIDFDGTVKVIDNGGEIVTCPSLNAAARELLEEIMLHEGEEVTVIYEARSH